MSVVVILLVAGSVMLMASLIIIMFSSYTRRLHFLAAMLFLGGIACLCAGSAIDSVRDAATAASECADAGGVRVEDVCFDREVVIEP